MRLFAFTAILLSLIVSTSGRAAVWGGDYFPNVELTTHAGEKVRFFDDLLEDKVVLVNFIYTSCVDVCPMETAQLVQVQRILGDRLGKDVFFYSISIDPENDSPDVLRKYRERFQADWTFLTGDEQDITQLRKKLGLYIAEIQNDTNNHNVNMIIGNQATGRWMKRSPFENPHVLADQIGNWLHGWKTSQEGEDYAQAPKLRSIPDGELLFRTRCSNCHTITGKEAENALGPDLIGVTEKRDANWLLNWMRSPDQMLAAKDPIALSLLKQYNNLPMPNLRLNRQEVDDLIDYIDIETQRLRKVAAAPKRASPSEDVVAVMNAWVRATDPGASANGGYMTLLNVSKQDQRLTSISSAQFNRIEMHEMAMVDGMMNMLKLDEGIVIPASGSVQFAPGGKHLMMFREQGKNLEPNQTVDILLTFEGNRQQLFSVKVLEK